MLCLHERTSLDLVKTEAVRFWSDDSYSEYWPFSAKILAPDTMHSQCDLMPELAYWKCQNEMKSDIFVKSLLISLSEDIPKCVCECAHYI